MKSVPEFDGLRGYLSTLVVIGHIYNPMVIWGLGCMDLFFALSAFLISDGIIKKNIDYRFYKKYAIKRILRIWPNYYLLFFVCLALSILFYKYGQKHLYWFPYPSTIYSFFFLQNVETWFCLTGDRCPNLVYSGFLLHTWSLALEEQFYLVVLLIIWALLKSRQPLFLSGLFAAVCIIGGTVLRSKGASSLVLPSRFDAFSVGIFLAFVFYYVDRFKAPNFRLKMVLGIALFISLGPVIYIYLIAYRKNKLEDFSEILFIFVPSTFSIFGFLLLSFIKIMTQSRWLFFLRWKVWVELGNMSYSTYLWHFPAIVCISALAIRIGVEVDWKVYLIEALFCFTISRAAFIFVERPARRLSEKFTKRSSH